MLRDDLGFIFTIYEDKAGTMWIGTWDKGVYRVKRPEERFVSFAHSTDDTAGLQSNDIRLIRQVNSGAI